MGPRSRDRGNDKQDAGRHAGIGASMGPRSRDRGNDQARACTRYVFKLQWGRDHVIAEIWLAYRALYAAPKLQWGRDHVIAEIPNVERLSGDVGGFNGAAIT